MPDGSSRSREESKARRQQHARRAFRERAYELLEAFGPADFLRGLTATSLVNEDEPHLTKHEWRVNAGYSGDGRDQLIDDLIEDATRANELVTAVTVREVRELLGRIERRDRLAIAEIRQVAADDLREYLRDKAESRRDIVRALIAVSAQSDESADAPRERLRAHYTALTKQLSDMYIGLLDVLGRKPLDRLGDDPAEMTKVITALADGLMLRARADPGFRADMHFADVIIPVFMALTRPVNGRELSDEELVYGANADSTVGGSAQGETQLEPTLATSDNTADVYRRAIEAITEAMRDGHQGVIRHASMHGHAGAQDSDEIPEMVRLREVMFDALRRGWRIRRLVTVVDAEKTYRQVEHGEAMRRQGPGRVDIKVMVHRLIPTLVPLIVDRNTAILAIDDPYTNVPARSVTVRDETAVNMFSDHFDQIWDDSRAHRIFGPAGADRRALAAVRAELDLLQAADEQGDS